MALGVEAGRWTLNIVLVLVRLVLRFARRRVIHLGDRLVGRVHIVETEGAAGVLQRNRAARLVLALLFPPSRCRRAEASRPVRNSGCDRARCRAPSCRSRTGADRRTIREDAAQNRRRAWEDRRSSRLAAAARRGSVFACARFADRERPPVEELSVEALDRLLRVCAVDEFDESEPARPAVSRSTGSTTCDGGATAPKCVRRSASVVL